MSTKTKVKTIKNQRNTGRDRAASRVTGENTGNKEVNDDGTWQPPASRN